MNVRTMLQHLYKQGKITDYQFTVINRNLKDRPQGHWIIENKNTGIKFYCSICEIHQEICFDFCPNCGADMRGEDNND